MKLARRTLLVLSLAFIACSCDRDERHDEIAACLAAGGRWVDGCGPGQCERDNGVEPESPPGLTRFEDGGR